MIRVTSLEEIEPGDVLWAYARGYWRQVRVVGKRRRTVTVAYVIRATQAASASVKVQALAANRFRRDRPVGHYGILDAPAPQMGAAALLANVVEELLVELPRRRLQVPMSPLGEPPCVCECGAQFAYIEGLTESRACCVFCSQRKRRARLAADGDRARNEGEEALRNTEETRG